MFATNVKSLRGRDVLSLIVPDHREVFEPVMRRMRELRHAHEKRAAARRAALRQQQISHMHRVASSSNSDSEDDSDSSPKSASEKESKESHGRRSLDTSERILADVLASFFVLISGVVLVNLLIAMMGYVYHTVIVIVRH